jgi:hypothetical protein
LIPYIFSKLVAAVATRLEVEYVVSDPSFFAAAINASRSKASWDAWDEAALLEALETGALVAAGTAVGGTAVGGTAVGATVGAGAGAQAAAAIKSIVRTMNIIVRRMVGSPLGMVSLSSLF